jgi:putative acetyltransferase
VTVTHRLATLRDAKKLFELRRQSIVGLAPNGMSASCVEAWAAGLTVSRMEAKIREMEILVAAHDMPIYLGDKLEGLYTAPEFAGQRIWVRIVKSARRIDANARYSKRSCRSSNTDGFYLRRGYEPLGPRLGDARQIVKHLNAPTA